MAVCYELVLGLLRAAMGVASRSVGRLVDSPADRVMSVGARVDVTNKAMEEVLLLVAGTAAAATSLTFVLAEESDRTTLEGLASA
ncbi:hypothetical protein ACWGLF_46525 [Streptomyces puniciscabiei]